MPVHCLSINFSVFFVSKTILIIYLLSKCSSCNVKSKTEIQEVIQYFQALRFMHEDVSFGQVSLLLAVTLQLQ
jgi:phosphoglycerol transferase MdoB-like AlkP superfamily enzyme